MRNDSIEGSKAPYELSGYAVGLLKENFEFLRFVRKFSFDRIEKTFNSK